VAILAAMSLGVALAGATPHLGSGATAPPGKEPFPCDPEATKVIAPAPLQGGISLCGSRFADQLHSKLGHTIRSYPGNDKIWAKNGKVDEIWGGPGTNDMARVDAKDTVKGDIEKCPPRPTCPKAAPTYARIDKGEVVYPATQPIVICDLEPGTNRRRMWFPREPFIRAVDTTKRVDWQTVAWTPLRYKFDGVNWVANQSHIWLFDRTFDPTETATPFLGNYWRHLKSKQRYFIWFYVDEPGTYRISVKYYWYKTANIAAHEEEYYVDDHFGEFETDNTHTSCTFPA
jgi:hypothetical protein